VTWRTVLWGLWRERNNRIFRQHLCAVAGHGKQNLGGRKALAQILPIENVVDRLARMCCTILVRNRFQGSLGFGVMC
jgi:hypothetical protein